MDTSKRKFFRFAGLVAVVPAVAVAKALGAKAPPVPEIREGQMIEAEWLNSIVRKVNDV